MRMAALGKVRLAERMSPMGSGTAARSRLTRTSGIRRRIRRIEGQHWVDSRRSPAAKRSLKSRARRHAMHAPTHLDRMTARESAGRPRPQRRRSGDGVDRQLVKVAASEIGATPSSHGASTPGTIARPTSRQARRRARAPGRRELSYAATPVRPRTACSVSLASSRAVQSTTRPAPPAALRHPPRRPRPPADVPCSAAT